QAADYLNRGGVEYAQKLLIKTLGAEDSRRMIDRVVKSLSSAVAFNIRIMLTPPADIRRRAARLVRSI
ncbi:MAG: hypothetical protein ABL958_20875, partial [Bdellovibrionia bacterium]